MLIYCAVAFACVYNALNIESKQAHRKRAFGNLRRANPEHRLFTLPTYLVKATICSYVAQNRGRKCRLTDPPPLLIFMYKERCGSFGACLHERIRKGLTNAWNTPPHFQIATRNFRPPRLRRHAVPHGRICQPPHSIRHI